jgi:hypothetical protein
VELHKRQRLAPYDVALKGFRYHDALDQALQSKHPRTIVAVMEELLMRRVRPHTYIHTKTKVHEQTTGCARAFRLRHTRLVHHGMGPICPCPRLPCAHLVSLIPPPHRV